MTRSSLTWEIKHRENETLVVFTGDIDETAELTPLGSLKGNVTFDLAGIGGVNSEGARRWIFEGFFTDRDIHAYSSRRPFDFNAGGKGSDLLRMKIFSERYHFNIHMRSTRCGFIPRQTDICPGRIRDCRYCLKIEDCYRSGDTLFSLHFAPVRAT